MGERILVFIPAYNCEKQIGRVLAQMTPEVRAFVDTVIVVDNRSTDGTAASATEALKRLKPLHGILLRNDENYGLGGSHKVAFNYALDNGFDYVIVLHGDDQGSIADILPHLQAGAHRTVHCLLGARFMKGSTLPGYSRFRTFGNHVFNTLYSLVARHRLYDLGSGLNLYAVSALADRSWLKNRNDLTFNYYMILRSAAAKWTIRFFPLSWREEDQQSNVKLVRQSLRVLAIAGQALVQPKNFAETDFSGRAAGAYPSSVVFDNLKD